MTIQGRQTIFVSYSHDDDDACTRVFTHLKNLNYLDVDVWIDREKLRDGDSWHPLIDGALAAADLAVLLVSPAFLESKFIRTHELRRLRERREGGTLRVIPVILEPCAWRAIEWLAAIEHWPKGDQALSELGEIGSARHDRALASVVVEIASLLAPPSEQRDAAPGAEEPLRHNGSEAVSAEIGAAIDVLRNTVLRAVGGPRRDALARTLIERVRKITGLSNDGVLNAVRFCIEYHLLNSEHLVEPLLIELSQGDATQTEDVERLRLELKRRSKLPDFADDPIQVTTHFFRRTLDREAEWKAYFDALEASGLPSLSPAAIESLCEVRVSVGFLSPQYLVAGLMSRFSDDWRPVLNAYRRAVPDPKFRSGAFESLQASQWNCWLVWGPSIPVCTCAMWNGVFALQFGYGDENNSVPLIELYAAPDVAPRTLGPLVAQLRDEGCNARPVRLTGRLRWAPWFLKEAADTPDPGAIDNMESLDAVDGATTDGRIGAAPAQATLYGGLTLAHRHHSDGLVLKFERVDKVANISASYFSAYLWLMFLVALPPREDNGPPTLLRGKPYPPWPEPASDRARVRQARLWEDLVPVFVHANIADPAALTFQKKMLVDNSVELLRQLWTRRAELFHHEDVAAGVRLYLVGGSDYTGCGCEVRYPSRDRLPALLRQRLRDEVDRDFASAVILPPENVAVQPPDELAGFFSTCHLPELITDYYEHIRSGNLAMGGR